MVAFWMIGYEDRPMTPASSASARSSAGMSGAMGMGVHPFGDPTLVDDFEQVGVAIDARDFHDYAAVDRQPRHRFHRSRAGPNYRPVATVPTAADARHLSLRRPRRRCALPQALPGRVV